MLNLTITLYYETMGKRKMLEFKPVSAYRLRNKDWSFGVPQRIKAIIERKSFKLIEVPCKHYDGLSLQYVGVGYSTDNSRLFFHFRPF